VLNFITAGSGLTLPADVLLRRSMDDRLEARLRVKEATESFCSFARLVAERIEERQIEMLEDPERWDGME